MEEDPHGAKRRLRDTLLAARRHISVPERRRVAQAICERVTQLDVFRDARDLVAYAALGAEVDPHAIVEAAIARGCRVYYPRLAGDQLEFREASPKTLVVGSGGFAEAPADGAQLSADSPALALVPGVGFDPAGRRLGRGGGHYDRALARHSHLLSVGLASELQIVDGLPTEEWDRAVDLVVTERRIIVPADLGPRVTKETESCR